MQSVRAVILGAVGLLALSAWAGVAHAQTGSTASGAAEKGYVEGVAQSAFGNVTSQSYGLELGLTVASNLQVFAEIGQTRNAAPAILGTRAQLMAGALAQTQAGVGVSAKEPVTFGVAGVKYLIPVTGSKAVPYVLGGLGIARVTHDVVFTAGGTDVTSTLPQLGIVLGTDLSGDAIKPMLVFGGGVTYPVWRQVGVDLQFRFGRIFAEEQAINVSRAGIGLGVRF